MGGGGHTKVPQIGRVIIQDDVEIGANTTIDRGAIRDTVIGEGTKIDNLVQIGHNVQIGRHCMVVAQMRHLRQRDASAISWCWRRVGRHGPRDHRRGRAGRGGQHGVMSRCTGRRPLGRHPGEAGREFLRNMMRCGDG